MNSGDKKSTLVDKKILDSPKSGIHFSIVKINPEDTPPSHGFDDAILPLYYALQRLGYNVEILFNRFNSRSRNIIFGSCIAPRRVGRYFPSGSIIFNLEQFNLESKWNNSDYLCHLRSFTVWDYSQLNVDYLKEKGIQATLLPLGYVKEMSRLFDTNIHDDRDNFKDKTIDILFYGLLTERRDIMIRRLLAEGVKVIASQNAFGNLRDKLLASSKMVLNIHNYLPARLEVVRLGYLWANKIPVISEIRDDTYIPQYLSEACHYLKYDEMAMGIKEILNHPSEMRSIGERGFKAFASIPMEEGLQKIVGKRVKGLTADITLHSSAKVDGLIEWHLPTPSKIK